MSNKTQHLNTLSAALRGAGLARAGAMIALALGAAHVSAQTTYTVPLTFNITLAAPECSLTVTSPTGSSTADKNNIGSVSAVTMNLTPTPLSVGGSPNDVLTTMGATGMTSFGASSAGIYHVGTTVQRRLSNPPTATATCSSGTYMTVSVTKTSTTPLGTDTAIMGGSPTQAGQAASLPIGMLMGIASFGGTTNPTSGQASTTYGAAGAKPTQGITASGASQAIGLTAALYANSTTKLLSTHVGTWTYGFNVNLEF